MKILIPILIILTFASCVSQKRCNSKFPPQTVTIIKDSIRFETIYKDTTIFVTLPVQKVTVFDTVYIKNGIVQFREVKASSNYADARAWIGQNRLNLTVEDKDTTLQFRLDNALKMARYYEMKFNTEQKTLPPEKFVPKWVKVLAWIGVFFLIGLVLWLIKKFLV